MRFGFVQLRLFTELLSVRVFFSIDKCVLRVFSLHAHGVATAVDPSDLEPIEQKSTERITRVRAGPNQPAWRIIVSAMSCGSALQE